MTEGWIASLRTLTVTAKGQVTLRKDLLKHLGVHPGEEIAVEKLPDGRIEVRAAGSTGRISDAFISFDKKAARLMAAQGLSVRLLS